MNAKRAGRILYATGKLSFVEEGMIYYCVFDRF
jgi:hypothetical protein